MLRLDAILSLAGASLRAEFQYRTNVITGIVGSILYQLTSFLTVWIIVDQFNTLAGWSLSEIMLLYGMRMMAHGVFYATTSQIFELDRLIVNGEFDRYLLRPIPPLIQVLVRKVRVNAFGDLLGGAALLAAAGYRSDIDWSFTAVIMLTAAIIGGALVEGATQIVLSSLAFRFLRIYALQSIVSQLFNVYGNYPFPIFPRLLQYVLTFALPIAFVAYLPASIILDRSSELHVAEWLAWGTPVIGLVFFILAIRVWNQMGRGYTSTGS